MNSYLQNEGEIRPGRITPETSEPEQLEVLTGLPDDTRRPLRRDDPKDAAHYAQALHALRRQREWSDERHADFWTALLAKWPRPRGKGARQKGERVALQVDYCRSNLMLSNQEIAALLDNVLLDGMKPDSYRRRRYADVGDQAVRGDGLDRDPDAARPTRAPLVVTPGDDTPDCLIAHVTEYSGQYDDGRSEDRAAIEVLVDRVLELEGQMFARGELVRIGSVVVRSGNFELAQSEQRRLLEQADFPPTAIEKQQYERERGGVEPGPRFRQPPQAADYVL